MDLNAPKNTPKEQKQTPLMEQYCSIKKKYPHAFVFFRLGDFYEMFGEDARSASAILGITLTKRQEVPMCGVPHHSVSRYISKLLKAGRKVAICEQVETPAEAKNKLVKRKVVRVITPGTVVEDELLNADISNHLLCVCADSLSWAVACVEVSTGDFWASQGNSGSISHQLSAVITRINPSEILADQKTISELKQRNIVFGSTDFTVISSDSINIPEKWKKLPISKEDKKLALQCALNVCRYVETNEPHLTDFLVPDYRENTKFLELDENAINTLELVESANAVRKQTLWGVLNKCHTSMGARMLCQWILHPLMDLQEITQRQNCVEKLLDEDKRSQLGELLDNVADIERVVTKITAQRASPGDIGGVRDSLSIVENLNKKLKEAQILKISDTIDGIYSELTDIYTILSNAITNDLPSKIGEGKEVIKRGYSDELDQLRLVRTNAAAWLRKLQEKERANTGISSLKVSYNSVFGYYIEITKSHLSKVPYNYVRKQTLVNSERFITQELKEMESKILGAEDKMIKLETYLFEDIRNRLLQFAAALKIFANTIAELDVFISLAQTAVKNRYIKPEIDKSRDIVIEGGRHPVVEQNIAAGEFVSNDLKLDDNLQIMIITGPNMSGKSVYLRQNALIVIMAQMGSFVPAKKARLGITDRIMTRIGAKDILSKGESTYMVEMKETAAILDLATSRSIVLLDEVGRGTSTFDGISIAWAVTEFLYDTLKGPRVLFATHYFELTGLEEKYPGIKNFNVKVEEITTAEGKNELVFLHKVSEGPSDKSYGIHVAELAGINPSCILRARGMLKKLENRFEENERDKKEKLPLFERHPVLEELVCCNPEKLTPLQALKTICEWKKRL